MLELSNNSVSDLMIRATLDSGGYFNVNVLAELENVRASLDQQIAETYGQIEQIASLAIRPDLDPLAVDWPKVIREAYAQARAERLRLAAVTVLDRVDTGLYWLLGAGWERRLALTLIDGLDAGLEGDEGLVELFASTPFRSDWFVDVDSTGVNEPTLLRCFLLLLVASEREVLRSLVAVAIATLLSRLRSAGVRNSIAVCQRNFFTHHGAHPPEDRPRCRLGSFSGRVFQPQVA